MQAHVLASIYRIFEDVLHKCLSMERTSACTQAYVCMPLFDGYLR